MKHTTPKKSIADFSKNAIATTDQLTKIKGGSVTIIIDLPLP